MFIYIFDILLADLIWGVAFVAQSIGGDLMGAYSFNFMRSIIGFLALIPVALIMSRSNRSAQNADRKQLIQGGLVCGFFLFIASNLQQLGITLGASVGKAGFLTACYILIVPILGIFIGQKCHLNVLIGVGLALIGLYLLCMTSGDFSITGPDLLLLLCALAFAFQIHAVGHYSKLCNAVQLSCLEFLVCGLLSLIPTFLVDMKHSISGMIAWTSWTSSGNAWIAILYAGILSSGVAYTLQIAGQKGLSPTVASLLMSMESVFSLVAGWILLGEKMTGRELIGCAIILAAVIIAQLPQKKKSNSAGQ